jgi:hypothetical protein
MIFSDESAGICKVAVIGFCEIVWLPAKVSAALKRPGIKTRDLKRQSGLMRETVTPAPAVLPGKSPVTREVGGFLGPRVGLDVLDKRKNLYPQPGFEPWFVQLGR